MMAILDREYAEAQRSMKAGHQCVVFDSNPRLREELAEDGATAAGSLDEMVKALTDKPRALWVTAPRV